MSDFVIIVDTAEQHAFTFAGLKSDADKGYTAISVDLDYQCLGRHPNSLGDYSLFGGVGHCHVERKSLEDAQTTILGFNDGHRARFENELLNLSKIASPLVVVECTLEDLLKNAPEHGKKTAQQNAKILFRSVLSYQQDYRVPWLFCESRRMAEQATYWFLHRWWEKNLKVTKRRGGQKTIGLLDSV